MENNKIAIFLDIDGTLYDSKIKAIPLSTLHILEELEKDDMYDLYIATGRSHNTLGPISAIKSKFKGFVLANGQNVIIDNKTIYEGTLNYQDVNDFVSFCNDNTLSIVLLTSEGLYYNHFNPKSKDNFENYIKAKVDPLNNRKFKLGDIIQEIWLFAGNDVIEPLKAQFPKFKIINWGSYGADIIPCNISKGKGVLKVIEYMGYSLDHTYCIGDGDNDVDMFKEVGTSICMENGSPKAKSAATFIGFNVSDDGLMKNIQTYIMNKK